MFSTPRKAARPRQPVASRLEGFDAAQIAALPEARRVLDGGMDAVLDDFYQALDADPAARAMLAQSPGADRLREAQKRHWRALLSGAVDDTLRERSRCVGEAHARAGLKPYDYIAGYSYLVEGFLNAILARQPKLAAQATAVARAAFIDMALALSSGSDASGASGASGRRDEARVLAETVEKEMRHLFDKLAEKGDDSPILHIEQREIRARRRAGGVVWFDFKTLCGGPRSMNDYLEIASQFHTVLLSDVPHMPVRMASEARRFTWLVDVFYDRRVKLIMSAAVEPEALYTEGPLAHEFPRTVSRLNEMQSTEFLALERRTVDTRLT